MKKYRLIAGLPLRRFLCIWCENHMEADKLPCPCPTCGKVLTFEMESGLPPLVARVYATALEDMMKVADDEILRYNVQDARFTAEVSFGTEWWRA